MKITNNYDLPEAVVRAVTQDPYTYTGNISVTQLISPPQLRWLFIRHNDKLEEDVVDNIWRLLGSAVHGILERAVSKHSADLQEERLDTTTAGWVWSGQTDIWEHPGVLMDYKVTSVWASMFGIKDEWSAQLNMLAYLYRKAGFAVNDLFIVAIFRDWHLSKVMTNKNYPPVPAEKIQIPMWTEQEIVKYVTERITLHKESEHLPDEELPPCSASERWQKETKYAIKKNKNMKASKVCGSKDEAIMFASELQEKHPKDTYKIEVRHGENTRCEHYCPVKAYCHQYQQELLENEEIFCDEAGIWLNPAL